MELKHFQSRKDVLSYVFDELLDTLLDDEAKMLGSEARHYTCEDRQEMADRIEDIQAIRGLLEDL